jgi:ParB-like chromosome segregation protein Spo0J
MASHVRVTSETVAVGDLREHPANPRRGDVDAIAASLEAHGQYRPIVAQRSTGYILAGNHTWKAARRLRWKRVAVTWVNVDDQTAAKIMVADNRTSDLATYNDDALASLLRALPDLDGSGFDTYDIERLEGVFDKPFTASEATGPEPGGAKMDDKPQVRIGPYWLRVAPAAFTDWTDALTEGRTKKQAFGEIRFRLGLLPPLASEQPTAPERPTEGVETVDLATLAPYPANARQGDVGAISESLRTLGQYRPIVANRRDRTILVGNHTWQAAKMLGWTQIAVSWVDVDDTQAAKIVTVDNRTSDLATYDDEMLASLLVALSNTDGTGFAPADVDDLLAQTITDTPHRRPATTSKTRCIVAHWTWQVGRDQWATWQRDLQPEINNGQIHDWIATALQLPDNQWTAEDP